MESYSWTICCLTSCSNGIRHMRARVIKDHMLLWNVTGKERCCCQLMPRVQEGKDDDQP